jgi:hypothetical protein
MGPRRTNLALLVVLLAALATGGLAFAAGTGWGRPVVAGHAVAGLAHATGALAGLGPLSAMQLHVGAALVALPLLAWHTVARGGIRARRTDLSRRALIRAGGVAAGAGLPLLAVEGAPPAWRPARRPPPLHRVAPGGRNRGNGRRRPDPGDPVAGRPGPGPRPGRLAAAGPRRRRDP